MKNQRGITLIALVVTIVVLLILAGITITYVLSDGGIFNSAKNAATSTNNAVVKEYADQAVITSYATYYDPTIAAADKDYGAIMQNCFPTGAFEAKPTVTCAANAEGKVVVTMAETQVTVNNAKYKVKVENSSVTVTPVAE